MTATTEIQTATTTKGTQTLFESVACSRCGGCGHYSWNAMTGSRCFKCGGQGVTVTKRGAAAQSFYRGLLSKRADEIVPGDKVLDNGIPGFVAGGWRLVTAVGANEDGTVRIEARDWTHGNANPDQLLRVARTAEFKAEAKKQALAFQATLTKAGTPRKAGS